MKETKEYLTSYYHDGRWWGTSIQAYDEADAKARCKRLGMQYDGLCIATIPGWVPAWLIHTVCVVRNFFARGSA